VPVARDPSIQQANWGAAPDEALGFSTALGSLASTTAPGNPARAALPNDRIVGYRPRGISTE